MMSRFKQWLWKRFLPDYCRDSLLEKNARLCSELLEQQREIAELKAYIRGMERVLRSRQRLTIRSEVDK